MWLSLNPWHVILPKVLISCFSDEKERFDPTQFQESIVQGLNQSGTDLEAVAKFLDASGAKLDYRRYAETLFDILVAGGMLGEYFIYPNILTVCVDYAELWQLTIIKLDICFSFPAPGGTLSDDMTRTEFCVFTAQEDLETMQAYAQVCNWDAWNPLVWTLISTFARPPPDETSLISLQCPVTCSRVGSCSRNIAHADVPEQKVGLKGFG